ncbi:uncharacterized protein [Rutidosis leptorrhynchoides]|uniref:uncharacterized protein n=1 Tax=Rutidosis leptorrhynchoides TaxID=125765 RepID=UPI003A98F046
MKDWEISNNQVLVCPLCGVCSDSLAHLFFECSFSRDVWQKVLLLSAIATHTDWMLISNELATGPINSAYVVVSKLMFAACVYFIWQERNSRIFKKGEMRVYKTFNKANLDNVIVSEREKTAKEVEAEKAKDAEFE